MSAYEQFAPRNGDGMRISFHSKEGARREATLSSVYADESMELPMFAQLALTEACEALESLANCHVRVQDNGDQTAARAYRRLRRKTENEGNLRRFNRRKGDLDV